MKTFMEVCQNWGAEGCHSYIAKWKSIEQSEVKEGIQLHPGKEKADEICKNCIAFSFKECPDCGSTDVVEMIGFKLKKNKKIMGSTYACKNCDFSFTKTRLI